MTDISNKPLLDDGDSTSSRRTSEGSQDSWTGVTQRTFNEGQSRRKRTSSECSPRHHSTFSSARISAFGASELSQDGFSGAAATNFANTENGVPQFGQLQTLDSSDPAFPSPIDRNAVFGQSGGLPASETQESFQEVAFGASTPVPTEHRGRAASLESSFTITGSYPEEPSTLTKQVSRLGALLLLDSARKDQPAFKRSRRHWNDRVARSSNLPPSSGPAAAATSIASSTANPPLAAAEVAPATAGRFAKQIANTPVPNRRVSQGTNSSGVLHRGVSRRLNSTPASTVGQHTPCGRTPIGNTTPVPSKILKPHVQRRPAKPGLRLRRFNSLNAGTSRVETEHDLDVALLQPMELMGDGESSRLIRAMVERQVRMICVDFDKTFVKVHTHSRWDSSKVDQLKCKVRPAIRALMLNWLSAGMVVSIVTFSSQHELIEAVVRSVFPAKFHSSIVVVSSDSTFRATVEENADRLNKFLASRTNIPAHDIQSGRDLGKMRHIWVAIQRFSSASIKCPAPLGPSHCVLIDDSQDNINVCQKFTAVRSFHLMEENKSALFDSMREEFLGAPPARESSIRGIAPSGSGSGGGGAEFSPGVLATAPLERANTFPLPHPRS